MNEDLSNISIEENNKKPKFWKHIYNYKYYILPFMFAIYFGINYYISPETANQYSFLLICIITAIIATIKFKSNIFKKFLVFIVMLYATFFFSTLIFKATLFISETIDIREYTRINIIENALQGNKNLPMIINEEAQIIKFSSSNNRNITTHIKFINYTKEEFLEDFQNSVTVFEDYALHSELNTSCHDSKLQNALSNDIEMQMMYFDKYQNIIGIITLNEEKCNTILKNK